jgi:hypothetical protein
MVPVDLDASSSHGFGGNANTQKIPGDCEVVKCPTYCREDEKEFRL